MSIDLRPAVTYLSWFSDKSLPELIKEYSKIDDIYKKCSQTCDQNYHDLNLWKSKYAESVDAIAQLFSSILKVPKDDIKLEDFRHYYMQMFEKICAPSYSKYLLSVFHIIAGVENDLGINKSFPNFFHELINQNLIKSLTKQADTNHYRLVALISRRNELINQIGKIIASSLIIHHFPS